MATTPSIPAAEPIMTTPAPTLQLADRVPANWILTSIESEEEVSDLIEGYNNVTNTKFSGTREEFSAFIRA